MQTFQSYAPPRSAPAVPPMRGRPELPLPQTTPIYDALYTEFQRAYRTLPGDRSGEEGLSFTGFAPWQDGGDLGLPPQPGASTFRRHEYASRRATGYAPTLHTTAAPSEQRLPAGPGGRHRFALPPGRG